jgi:hypothetical protein
LPLFAARNRPPSAPYARKQRTEGNSAAILNARLTPLLQNNGVGHGDVI